MPADTPLGILLPAVVDILEPAGGTAGWQLSPIGKAPLSLKNSLRGNGIHDGDVLLLTPAEVTLPPPRFDDVTEAVLATVDNRPRWTAGARRVAGTTAGVWSCLLGALALLHGDLIGGSAAPIAVPALAATVALTAAIAAGRVYRSPTASTPLTLCAIVFGSAAGYLAVPGPHVIPKVVLAAAVGTTVTVLGLRVAGAGTTVLTACATFGALITAALAGYLLVSWRLPTTGAVLVVTGVASLMVVPRLAIAVARVPLPDSTAATHIPANVDERARRAEATLTGLVCGLAAATVVGSALTATHAAGMALAGLGGTVVLMRSRFHVDRVQAAALITGGALCLTVVFVRSQLFWPTATGWFAAGAVCAATAAFALGWVTMSPTPSVRRCVDIADYLALAAVAPVTCWVCGIYAAVRGMRLS